MNITELDQFNLADTVKFHDRLNPRLWGQDEHLLPEVRERLEAIADDFREFLGVSDLDIEDITVSGSNAAYSYTPQSDIDLHLVVRLPQANADVLRELFAAKKYQYNDEHDIRIGGADVELYVQPSGEPHISQGIYSVKNQDWIQVPRRRRPDLDDTCVAHKTEDLQQRIGAAVERGDETAMQRLWSKIKTMRQTGLEQQGEFGCDNLVFKTLRRIGDLERLKKALTRAHDERLSLAERRRRKKRTRYAYGGYWTPGFAFGTDSGEGGGDGGGESVIRETKHDQVLLKKFMQYVIDRLGIDPVPAVRLHSDPDWSQRNHSFGLYDPRTKTLHVSMCNRHILDVMRTAAHELTHCRQHQTDSLPTNAGKTGSRWENQAHAMAGIIMRDFADANADLFVTHTLTEGGISKSILAGVIALAASLSHAQQPGGIAGALGTALKLYGISQLTQPAIKAELNQELINYLRAQGGDPGAQNQSWTWRMQNQQNQPQEPPPQQQNESASGYIPTGGQRHDPRFKTALTVDIKPGQVGREANKLALQTDKQGKPKLLIKSVNLIEAALRQQLESFKAQDQNASGRVLAEEDLLEIKMSPGNLAKMAKNIDARVGMEFELIVPNVQGEEENEFESEPDYDANERFPTGPGWTNEIMSFFRGGEVSNSARSINRAIDELNENFYDWVAGDQEEYINSEEGLKRARQIAYDNINQDQYDTEQELVQAVQNYLDENEEEIKETLIDEYNEDLDSKFEEWLEDNGISMMSDFANEHSLEWPYWTQPDDYYGGSGVSINDVADDFSQAIGRPVNASSSYHGATRRPGHYVVEPDSSLHGDEPGDGGLEFVSPPLTVDEMLDDIDKVAAWARRVGAYTNSSTGLHMNVSVPNQQNLDFVKLAMFLGDNYILEQFGRAGNSYCKSILKQIVGVARSEPGRVEEMMRQFQGGLNQLASKVLHTGSTAKYSSINNRGDWIEFRGPGNDWLDEDLNPVKNTLLRAVVATDVATKPEEFKQEYYKKLYKTLTQGREDDTIQYFARYAAGELPQSALKAFVRQIQGKRKVDKLTQGAKDILLVWKVTGSASSPYQSQGTEVLGKTELDAIAEAIKKWRLNIGSSSMEEWAQEHGWKVQPLRAATTDDMNQMSPKFYYVKVENSPRGVWVRAMSEFQARTMAVQRFPDQFANAAFDDIVAAHDPTYDGQETAYNLRARLGEPQPVWREPPAQQTPSRDQEFTGIWEIVSRNTDEILAHISGIGNAVADAERHAARWQQQTGFDDPVYVRPLMRPRDTVPRNQGEVERSEYRVDYTVTYQDETRNNSMTVPAANADAAMAAVRNRLERAGWTIDRIEAEPVSSAARGTESLPPGNTRWLVLDQNDREVYSFVHRNNQAEANQYAINWLRGNNMIGQGEFMVVPAR